MGRDVRLEFADVSREFALQAIELEIQYLLHGSCDFNEIIQLFDRMIPYQGFIIETRQANNRQRTRVVILCKGWRS